MYKNIVEIKNYQFILLSKIIKNQYAQILELLGPKKKLTYENFSDDYVTYYKYELDYPHAGAGKRVQF